MKPHTATKLAQKLPETIRIGAHDFTIILMDDAEAKEKQVFGQCSTLHQTISIQDNHPSASLLADTLIHEITHAMHWTFGINGVGDSDERLVAMSSSAWCQIYRATPWLLEWLGKALA